GPPFLKVIRPEGPSGRHSPFDLDACSLPSYNGPGVMPRHVRESRSPHRVRASRLSTPRPVGRNRVLSHRDHEPPRAGGDSNQDLAQKVAILRATRNSTADGILVTDNERRLVEFNSVFAQMWDVPPGVLEVGDHPRLIQHIRPMFPDVEEFGRRV